MKQQSKYENMAYAALWGLLFAAPLLSLYIRAMHDTDMVFDWHDVWVVWLTSAAQSQAAATSRSATTALVVAGRREL